jgi:2,3-bisphosphoglycerate-independent phosphoglycerate mutase
MLIVRDGWGINPGGREKREENGNATLLARTPFHDELYRDYPGGKLTASGADVGLPDGQMGNSEVGHLNLGAGRIVYQDLTRINKAIEEGELTRNPVLQKTFAGACGHRLHLLGLVSDGGVHSHFSHTIALADAAREAGVNEIFVHAFTDGRDTSPTGGAAFLKTCEKDLQKSGAQIVTVIGRYFAMDRDRRWDRTKKAWDAIVLGRGEICKSSPSAAVDREYSKGETDEFMPALIFSYANEQRVRDGDSVLFFNFRADRARQLSQAFLVKDFDGFNREAWPQVHFVTLTQYDVTYPSPFIFEPVELARILGEVVSAAGKSQLRIAETEKYAHVTYFFNGGIERPSW